MFHSVDPLAEEAYGWTPYRYGFNNPISFTDPTGMWETKYEDEEHRKLLETNDGSDAVVTITNDKRAGFDAAVKGTKNTDDVSWNNSMKKYALGFELSGAQENALSSLNSDWSRRNAILFWQNPTAGNASAFAFSEALSQWTNPELVVAGLSSGIAGYTATLKGAAKSSNYAYRSLTAADAASLKAGNGLLAKAPNGAWSLEEHLISGSSSKAWVNNPWIATSTDINIARSFSSGNGLVRINLSKLPASSMQRGWLSLPRSSAGYHYSIWQSEVSIFQSIPQSAIKVIK